jgi:hypothetical protein
MISIQKNIQMRTFRKFKVFIIIGIFSISFLIADYSIQTDEPRESLTILSKLMNDFGLTKQSFEDPMIITRGVSRQSSTAERSGMNFNSPSFGGINAKIIDSHEDFVDNNVSNIDGLMNTGTHSNFENQKTGPDNVSDTFTEADINTENQVILEVDSWNITRNKWGKTGTSPYLDNQSQPEVNEVHGKTGINKNGDEIGDFGFQDTNDLGTIISVKLRVYGHANPSYPTDAYFSVHLWNGSTWIEVMDFLDNSSAVWKEVDISTHVNTWTKINETKIFLRIEDPGGNKYGDQVCYMALLQIDITPTPIYELDIEVQWTSAEFTKPYAELAIYTGSCGTETLKVDVWNGSWITVIPNLIADSWNNISVVGYLNSSTFTIRFKGTNESSDSFQDEWNIDTSLLHTWDNDETPPVINDFGLDDPGTGIGVFWANITDIQSDVDQVTLNVNSSQYSMTYNATGFWTKQVTVEFNQYYDYYIENASDTAENYLISPSEVKNYTFTFDSINPSVDDWEYYANEGYNGTFKANISDSWGEVSIVIVNVTEIEGVPQSDLWAIMGFTSSGYINDTIIIGRNLLCKFTIIVNDTSGNSFTSLEHTGIGPNHSPEASDISITLTPRSNETLYANWTFSDVDGDNESSNWIIHWFKNGIHQVFYDNSKSIPSTATLKGEVWNYTLQVSDGEDYSPQYNSPSTTIINTPSEASDLTITPTPTSSDELITGWTSYDIDGDNPDDYLNETIIRWYRWTGTWTQIPGLMNETYVTSGNLTRGQIYRYELQLFDGEEYSQSYISLNTTVLNSLPVLTGNPSFNKTTDITPTDNINITYVYNDIDGDTEATADRIVYWYRNGKFNSSKTNHTILTSAETTSGETWQYVLKVNDGFNYSINYTSILISIGSFTNTVPEVQNITFTGNTNTTSEDLIASFDYFDADGHQQVEKEIIWYMNGTLQPNLNASLSVHSSLTSKNQIWNFTIKVFDGLDWSLQYNSSKLLIQNSIPQITDVQITSNTTTIYNLTIDWDFNDADGDNQENYDLKWYINDIYNSSHDDLLEIASIETKKGQDWICSIRIYDGENYSSWYNSSKNFIWNTPPSVQDLSLQGGQNTSQNITLNYSFNDVDDDNEDEGQATINWFYINGTIITGENSKELHNSYFVAGDILYAQITPNDGEDSGNMYQAEYLQVGNAIPSIKGSPNILGFNESSIYFAAAPLAVNYTAEDLDSPLFIYDIDVDENGLVVGSNYRWYKNGMIISDLTGPTVSSEYLSKGDEWIVSVQPRDRYSALGSWENSSPIIIGNTPPEIMSFAWTTISPTVQNDLTFSYTFFDLDSDSEWQNQTIIHWYKNGIEIPEAKNQSSLSKILFNKGDIINISIRSSDGLNYSLLYNSTQVLVVNAIPEAHNIAILPNIPYTFDTLQVSYDFDDYDNDNESSDWIVQWYRNGILVPELMNSKKVNAVNTSAGEVWIAHLRVFDYLNYSQEYILPPAIILNSAPRIIEVFLNENINASYADSNLYLNPNEDVAFYDPDQDPVIDYTITWMKNFESQPIYIDQTTLPESELSKGDIWFVIVRVFDGEDWSSNQASQEILIINKAPEIQSFWLTNNSYPEFLIENEDISLAYTFQDIDNDTDYSIIKWYQNEILLPEFNNLSLIPASTTSPGDVWFMEIQPYDGEAYGPQMNLTIYIESQPKIDEIGVDIISDIEGHYIFWVNVSDVRNPISEVFFHFIFQNDTLEQTKWAEFNDTVWVIDYELVDYLYLGNFVNIEVTAVSVVSYSTIFEIFAIESFDYVMEDEVAPRVIDAYFEKDDDLNPKFLTFHAQIEEFGSEVNEITLYYYFQLFTDGSGSSVADWSSSSMIFQNISEIEGIEYWSLTVDFRHNNSNYEILYYLSTSDTSGNEDPLAFDIRDFPQRINENRFIYKSQGLPEWLVFLSLFLVLCILIGSVTYIKFIRKPEVVGLDKNLVMKNISKIRDEEVITSLDLHTLGIVLSYFDQRSGPVPIIVIPDLLQDNIEPLIGLSDRSFNSCGFVEDFISKTFSSFDYALESLIRINSMSYGYAIENPEARGGSDNYTVNILIIPEMAPLINQFKEELQVLVHEIHMVMTNEPEAKDAILQAVINLRKRVSCIILSYKDIYKTTELIEEDISSY